MKIKIEYTYQDNNTTIKNIVLQKMNKLMEEIFKDIANYDQLKKIIAMDENDKILYETFFIKPTLL